MEAAQDFDITVDREPETEWGPARATVTVRMSVGAVDIRATGPRRFRAPEVQWPSIGSVPADDAAAFGAALAVAAEVAAELLPSWTDAG